MSRKWGEQRPDIKPATNEAANYAAMEKYRKKVGRIIAVVIGTIIAASLWMIVSYWNL